MAYPLSKINALNKAGQEFARLTPEQIAFIVSALTVGSLNQGKALTIHRESHGRYTENSGVDLSRTVGWYTSLYPQAVPALDSLEEWVKSLKDNCNADEFGGVTFHAGVMQNLWPHVGDMDVLFNYLGNLTQQMNDAVEVTNTGLWRDESNAADAAIVINASVHTEHLTWDVELIATVSNKLKLRHYMRHLIAASNVYMNCLLKPIRY
ncbi:hypothetical protein [Vibrio sp. ED004]|uniref:hypothetical protein n=1 Tax=Vibrio sp. ED004 TaxID=2785124 RepID=UPI0020BE69AE|nr:hypothetical protein [Vibrio sp. ED004]